MTEPIEMPFGKWTQVGARNHVLDGVQIPTHVEGILRGNSGQSDSAGGSTGTVQMLIRCILDGMHSGTTW